MSLRVLKVQEMELLKAGEDCVPCGAAMVMGAQLGGMIGGAAGAAIGSALVGLGPNCLDVGDSGRCDAGAG